MGRRVVVEADGGSRGNPGPAGYGAVVRDAATNEVLAEVAAGIGRASNNVAEYRGLIAGLRAAAELGDVESVEVRMDSKLVVEQMNGRWQVKHPDMRVLAREAAEVVGTLPRVTFGHIRRELNGHADRLANEAMDAAARGEEWVRATTAPGATAATAATPAGARGWRPPSGIPTTLLLVRHGETELSVAGRFSGTGDPELTERGWAQAKALAGRAASFGPVTAVWTSPLRRAADTAAGIAEALGLPVRVDDRLAECDFGEWEGLTFAQIQERDLGLLAEWMGDADVAAPGGESFAAVTRRVRQARDAVLAAHPGETVVVVSHVTPIKTLLRLALDAPPSLLHRLYLDLASLSQAEWYPDGHAIVRRVNDVAHLA
ncbi:MAG TPA: bifunctional RNase H/acid phosphatase [Frankiaceae bacterium]|nr:bifunctional RNase H/acid phosphatase [Frankiaceae bacterium]